MQGKVLSNTFKHSWTMRLNSEERYRALNCNIIRICFLKSLKKS